MSKLNSRDSSRGDGVGLGLRAAALAASCGVVIPLTLACGNWPKNPSPPTTATSNVAMKMSSSGAPKCTSEHRWEWTPVSVTGSEGLTTAHSIPASGFAQLEVTSTSVGLPGPERRWDCVFESAGVVAFAPGVWRISLHSPTAGVIAQCQVTLRVGQNWAGFPFGTGSCRETPAGSLGFIY